MLLSPEQLAAARSVPDPTLGRERRVLAEVSVGGFRASVFAPSGEVGPSPWASGLSHSCYDHRYFDLMAATVTERFTHLRIQLGEGSGPAKVVQPAFLVREDLLIGAPAGIRRAGEMLRKLWPKALSLNMLMIGNATGEGVLAAGPRGPEWTAKALAATLPALGRALKASLVVFKDYPKSLRGALESPLVAAGFARLPSMPGAQVPLGYKDFDDYLAKVHSRSRRADLRRKFRDAVADGPIELEVRTDLDPQGLAEEAHALYQAVYERATLRFEHLTPEFLRRLGRDMPDKARFFLWRKAGKLVAFNLCMVHDEPAGDGPSADKPVRVIKDSYIGLDYSVALDLHLYFLSWRDIIEWSIKHGVTKYWTAPLNYDPKLNLKMDLAPLDLYVRHVSGLLNPIARRLIPMFGPTHAEKILRQFGNFGELA